jgi:hypothetical protein
VTEREKRDTHDDDERHEEIREEREIREKRVSLEESIFNVLMFRYTVRIYIDRNQQTI